MAPRPPATPGHPAPRSRSRNPIQGRPSTRPYALICRSALSSTLRMAALSDGTARIAFDAPMRKRRSAAPPARHAGRPRVRAASPAPPARTRARYRRLSSRRRPPQGCLYRMRPPNGRRPARGCRAAPRTLCAAPCPGPVSAVRRDGMVNAFRVNKPAATQGITPLQLIKRLFIQGGYPLECLVGKKRRTRHAPRVAPFQIRFSQPQRRFLCHVRVQDRGASGLSTITAGSRPS
jgi:hypothetical protein